MNNPKDTLLNQGAIGNHIFRNRYIVAPMTRVSSENDGTPNEQVHRYYERFAKGGFAAVITEGIYPDTAYSQGYHNQAGLATDKHKEAWAPIVDSLKQNGSLAIAQIMHAGAQSQGNYYTEETVAPSPFSPPSDKVAMYGGSGPFPEATELSKAGLEEVKQGFVAAAKRAQEAGFDGIELHGANGYLLDQFLSDGINQRTDEYGGSIEKRVQLLLELIEETREAVGETMVVGIRISQLKATNGSYKWPGGEEDAKVIFSKLGQTDVDYIHLSDDDAKTPGFGEGTMSMAQAAKEFSGKPIINCGGLADPAEAAKLIAAGHCEFIGVARQALVDPDLPNRVLHDKPLSPLKEGLGTILADNTTPPAAISTEEVEMSIIENE